MSDQVEFFSLVGVPVLFCPLFQLSCCIPVFCNISGSWVSVASVLPRDSSGCRLVLKEEASIPAESPFIILSVGGWSENP